MTWSDLRDHEAEIRGLIARCKKDLEVQTTTDRLAHRIGRALVRTKGRLLTSGLIAT